MFHGTYSHIVRDIVQWRLIEYVSIDTESLYSIVNGFIEFSDKKGE